VNNADAFWIVLHVNSGNVRAAIGWSYGGDGRDKIHVSDVETSWRTSFLQAEYDRVELHYDASQERGSINLCSV
jgi:hypothetical protein